MANDLSCSIPMAGMYTLTDFCTHPLTHSLDRVIEGNGQGNSPERGTEVL